MTLICDLTDDRLLNGRLKLWQPRRGFRVSTDALFLAASIPARAGETVLDLGCGAGGACLALATRVPGVSLYGVEIQPDYAALARVNGVRNDAALTVFTGDATDPPAEVKALLVDHVLTNPPFFASHDPASPTMARDLGQRETRPLAAWIDAGLRRLRPGGALTLIHRTERLPEILAALAGRAGNLRVLPLQPRAGRPAKRFVLRAVKGSRTPFRLCPSLVVHAGAAHSDDGEDFTPQAAAILRDGEALEF